MEEQTETQTTTATGMNPLIPIGVLAAVVIIGIFVLATNGKKSQPAATTPSPTSEASPTTQPTETTGASSGAQMTQASLIQVTGGSFFFQPNEIRVKKGQKVTIAFTSQGGTHNFVIDELNVKTPIISAGKSTEVSFTPDKTGTFAIYCSVDSHRANGMEGKLIVE